VTFPTIEPVRRHRLSRTAIRDLLEDATATMTCTDPVTAACAETLFSSDGMTGARLRPDEIAARRP
jgi:hypothetical protein